MELENVAAPAVVFALRAGLIATRWCSPDSAFASPPASSAAGPFDTPACRKLAAALPLARPDGTTGGKFYMASSGPSAS
jgi:hypothetical protein